jgi:hypothetical protein
VRTRQLAAAVVAVSLFLGSGSLGECTPLGEGYSWWLLVVSLVRYLWKSCTKVVWCCPVASCQLSVAVAVAVAVAVTVAVAVAVTSCASSSVVRYLALVMRLSCASSVVTQLSTLARV